MSDDEIREDLRDLLKQWGRIDARLGLPSQLAHVPLYQTAYETERDKRAERLKNRQ